MKTFKTELAQNIHCIGLNFPGLVEEDEPLYFIKSSSSLKIVKENEEEIHFLSPNKIWCECELGLVVRKSLSGNYDSSKTNELIKGIMVTSDITSENNFQRDHHLGFSKSKKNFCLVSDEYKQLNSIDLENLQMVTKINSSVTQNENTSRMLFKPNEIISYILSFVDLQENDIILCGTPAGWQECILNDGDIVSHEITDLKPLKFKVKL